MAVKSAKDTLAAERFQAALKDWFEKSGLPQTAAAAAIGLSQGTLNNLLRKKGASIAQMEEIAEKLGLDFLEMLARGRDIMDGKAPSPPLADADPIPLPDDELESYEFLKIPFSDHMRLAAGQGGAIPYTYEADDSPVVLHRDALHLRAANARKLQAFRVGGDSMEPILAQGGIVVADLSKNKLDSLEEGAIYVLCWDRDHGECAVKRLRWAERGRLLAIESADHEVNPTIYRHPDEVLLIGKVIWSWREH